MKCPLLLALIALITTPSWLGAQNSPGAYDLKQECDPEAIFLSSPVEVLSDLEGVNFRPYLKVVVKTVKDNWYSIIPDEAKAPTMKKACVGIDFEILKDGAVGIMKVSSSSGDEQLDLAAWRGISGISKFPQLPTFYTKPSVSLRIHFYYNPDRAAARKYIDPWEEYRNRMQLADRRPTTVAPVTIDFIPLAASLPQGISTPLPAAIPGQTGTLLLSVVVGKKGDVRHVKVIQGLNSDLDRTTRETIETWKFEPTTRYGKAIEVLLNVKVTFNLK